MYPLTKTIPSIDPISFEFSIMRNGTSLMIGWSLLVMTVPCGSSSPRTVRHFASNSVVLINSGTFGNRFTELAVMWSQGIVLQNTVPIIMP